MNIDFKNEKQVKIADLIWEAQDQETINLILNTFGHDALVVYNMIVAETLDQIDSVDLAKIALEKIK